MASHDRLMDHAADVARYFIAFEAYRGSRPAALRALRGRAGGFAQPEYEHALDEGMAMFQAAVKIVAKSVSGSPRGLDEEYDLGPSAAKLGREHPGFPRSTYEWVVNWIHVYYHLM